MKRVFALLLLAALLLCGCSGSRSDLEPYTAIVDDWDEAVTLTVDPSAKTISDGTYLYEYTLTTINDERFITIIYPNGAVYEWQGISTSKNSSSSSGKGYDEDTYTKGRILVAAITDHGPEKIKDIKKEVREMIAIGPIFLVYGILALAFPYAVWCYVWRFVARRHREAYTEQMEKRIRIGGIIMTSFGAVVSLAVLIFGYC